MSDAYSQGRKDGDFDAYYQQFNSLKNHPDTNQIIPQVDQTDQLEYETVTEIVIKPASKEQNVPKEVSDTITLSLTLPEGTDSLVGQFKASNGHTYFVDARRIR